MFPSLLLLSCLFLTVEYNHGKILPPRNVSLWRINEFDYMVSWLPPKNSVGCKYKVDTKSLDMKTPMNSIKLINLMEGAFLNVSIKSFCNNSNSEPVVLNESNPELVTDFRCYVYYYKQTNCSWSPTGVTADFHMFYRYVNQHNNDEPSQTEECPLYIYTEGMKTGCSLPVDFSNAISILFNATLNDKTVRNNFHRDLVNAVRSPPLNWRIEKSRDRFNISWDPPELIPLDQWTFKINYTACNSPKTISTRGVTSHQLTCPPHCKCSIAIKAESQINGETPWSDTKYFDAVAGPNVLVYLAGIIPLVITILTVLCVMCYQKNEATIFPKVPEPRDLLSDICDNNNKITLCNFYVPTAEEDSCKIALVIDPQISKLDS